MRWGAEEGWPSIHLIMMVGLALQMGWRLGERKGKWVVEMVSG